MNGLVLVGHGSLRSAAGADMIRVAAHLRRRQVAPLVAPAFLNYSRPTLAEAVTRLVAQGVDTLTVQPYFLVAGKYVLEDLPQEIARLMARFPGVRFRLAPVLGAHPALVAIALDRLASGMSPGEGPRGLLLVAHGTPYPEANGPVTWAAARLAQVTGVDAWIVAYLDCNPPHVLQAVELLAAGGIRRVDLLPYFLQQGRHVREDMPRLVALAQARHPDLLLRLAPSLGDDPRLADVIADRLAQARPLDPAAIAAPASENPKEMTP